MGFFDFFTAPVTAGSDIEGMDQRTAQKFFDWQKKGGKRHDTGEWYRTRDEWDAQSDVQAPFVPAPQTLYEGGMPTETGYYDEQGNWVKTKDWRTISAAAQGMGDVAGQFRGSREYFEEYPEYAPTAIEDSFVAQQMGGLANLLGQIVETGQMPQAWQTGAQEFAAGMTGLGEQYAPLLEKAGTAMFGFTPEERQLREQYWDSKIAEVEAKQFRAWQAAGVSGASTMRLLAKSDEARREIRDYRIQSSMATAQEEVVHKAQALQVQGALMQPQKQYYDMVQATMTQATQVYAMQVNNIINDNQMYFNMYQSEQQALVNELNATKAYVQTLMAGTELQYKEAEQVIMNALVPFQVGIQAAQYNLAEEQLEWQQEQADFQNLISVLSVATSFMDFASTLGTGGTSGAASGASGFGSLI